MLIIFDLDDTLIETSQCLSPYYLKVAFDAMVQQGLKATYEELLQIHETTLSSRETLKQLWSQHSNQIEMLQAGLNMLKTKLPKEISLKCVPGALETLNTLQQDAKIALVTMGEPSLQLQKMEKAGIEPGRFSKLVVCEGPSKKSGYQMLIRDLQVDPKNVVVCGDRISFDLSPAKELGFFTVHFRNGRGVIHTEPKEDVDLTIIQLKELTKVLHKYEPTSLL